MDVNTFRLEFNKNNNSNLIRFYQIAYCDQLLIYLIVNNVNLYVRSIKGNLNFPELIKT